MTPGKVLNRRIDEGQFMEMREPVLSVWPTGAEVDLDEAVAYQKSLPASKSFLNVVKGSTGTAGRWSSREAGLPCSRTR